MLTHGDRNKFLNSRVFAARKFLDKFKDTPKCNLISFPKELINVRIKNITVYYVRLWFLIIPPFQFRLICFAQFWKMLNQRI
ncbi:MAG: hypothetical protein EA357_05690 [Micavibrio sp.]|nr:MAG: hypothetical protein EA357_05690 [Micavibrio sp.]